MTFANRTAQRHPYPWPDDGVRVSWWIGVGAISMLFLIILIIPFEVPLDPLWKRRLASLSLAKEMTLGTWWTAIMLASSGLLCLEQARRDRALTWPWVLLALVLLGLSLDEIGSIHERVGKLGWSAVIPFGAAGILVVLYACYRLWQRPATRSAALLILIGVAVLASVGGQEFIEHNFRFHRQFKTLRLSIEEGTELLGCFLILWGLVVARTGRTRQKFRAAIADPFCIEGLGWLLLAGLVLHVLVVWFVIPHIRDIPRRGNPGDWYPMLAYFVLAAFCLWKTRIANSRLEVTTPWERWTWDLAAVYFGICSALAVCNLYFLLSPPLAPYYFFDAYLTYGYKLAPFVLVFLALRLWSLPNLAILLILIALPALGGRIVHHAGFPLILSGLFPFGCALILLSRRGNLAEV